MRILQYCLVVLCFLSFSVEAIGKVVTNDDHSGRTNAVDERTRLEKEQDSNPFSILPFNQTYILPLYYASTQAPIYRNNTPNNQALQQIEVKFQISLKSPVWRDFFKKSNTLYIAYTQQSYWQAYNNSPFFRSNMFQPEIFLENNVNFHLPSRWNLQLVTPGAVHQSNGRGGILERSWNRVYLDLVFARGNLKISIKPWYIIHDSSLTLHNPNIGDYLGHGRLLVSYKFRRNVFSLESYNNVETGFHRGSIQLTWSFPLVKKIRGYAQFFSGYGQTMMEYNHRTDGVGCGIAFSDWL